MELGRIPKSGGKTAALQVEVDKREIEAFAACGRILGLIGSRISHWEYLNNPSRASPNLIRKTNTALNLSLNRDLLPGWMARCGSAFTPPLRADMSTSSNLRTSW